MKSLFVSVLTLTLVTGLYAADAKTPEQRKMDALKAAGMSPSAPKPATPAAGKSAPGSTGSGTGMETVTFPVSGMMCNNCIASVQDSFMKADGVTAAKPDMQAGFASVTFDKSKTSIDQIYATFMAKKARRFDAAKPGEKIKLPEYKYDGKEETLSGALAVKGKDAAEDVVCRVVSRRNGEEGERAFNVMVPDAAVRTKLEEARTKGDKPTLYGVVSEKGITVSKVE